MSLARFSAFVLGLDARRRNTGLWVYFVARGTAGDSYSSSSLERSDRDWRKIMDRCHA
jgi:hypothetical protein